MFSVVATNVLVVVVAVAAAVVQPTNKYSKE